VFNLHDDLGQAIVQAFRRGLLDVPYCCHPNNAGHARATIDCDGALRWLQLGNIPLSHTTVCSDRGSNKRPSAQLLAALNYNRARYDATPPRGPNQQKEGTKHGHHEHPCQAGPKGK
jgi:methylaspartate mutase epsilon subunit